ncbi:MAG: SDR family NAD(P)-dependent oxidoreductase, partial [Bacteroidota bacterium]
MANADKAKVYVITGASRGIGRDTIIEISRTERATRILAMARSAEKLSELEEELSGVSQCDLHTMAVDLTVPEQSQIAAWLDEFGPVD